MCALTVMCTRGSLETSLRKSYQIWNYCVHICIFVLTVISWPYKDRLLLRFLKVMCAILSGVMPIGACKCSGSPDFHSAMNLNRGFAGCEPGFAGNRLPNEVYDQ